MKEWTVAIWHAGGQIEGLFSLEEVLAMEYRYIQLDKERKVAWVTNCCFFRCH